MVMVIELKLISEILSMKNLMENYICTRKKLLDQLIIVKLIVYTPRWASIAAI